MSGGLLLAIDGDSLAHRAYHGIPKSVRLNAVVGFSNFLLRLWDSEQPEAVLVGWDSLETPTYRHEALPAYQSGREFEDSIVAQLALLPPLCEAFGFQIGKAGGYEADDFLAAGAAAWPGEVLVATSDRDAYQLVNDRVSILQPVKGVSELARIDEAGVRERYGVEPAQVPDFIALRGDPSDKIPGAPGVGPKKAAEVLKQHGSLAQALADGRFPTDRRRPAALPEHRDDGPGGATAEARTDAADLGERGRARTRARAEHPRGQARSARLDLRVAMQLPVLDRPRRMGAAARVRLVRRDEARRPLLGRPGKCRPDELG